MPRREDERSRNITGRHVEACTCQDCTDRFLKGKKIKPVLYVGSFVGHGRFVAAQDDGGKLVTDAKGKPIPYGQL